jgi:hypothetical protein
MNIKDKHVVYGLGGYDPTKPNNNIVEEYEVDVPQRPLSGIEIVATLNAVLGVWSLQDAANSVNLTTEQLVAEAEAWAVASA